MNANTPGAKPAYTETQGQYLAFIYYYIKLHGVPPAEADMQRYFKVWPPAVHNMIVTLEKRGFIRRTPGAARLIQLLLVYPTVWPRPVPYEPYRTDFGSFLPFTVPKDANPVR